MNNQNNNGIIFDNKPLDNSTVDYNALYNSNSNNQNVQVNNQSQIDEINKKINQEQVVAPVATVLENNKVADDSKGNKKGMVFIIIISILILAAIIFLFPYLIKNGY